MTEPTKSTTGPSTTAPSTTEPSFATARAAAPNRLFQAAAWVGIVAGVVFIVGAVFFTGFGLGRHSGHGGGWDGPRHQCGMMMPRPPMGGPGGGGPAMMGPGMMGPGEPGPGMRGPDGTPPISQPAPTPR